MDEQEIALRHSRILSQRGLYALECFGERKEEKKKKTNGARGMGWNKTTVTFSGWIAWSTKE